MIPHSLLAAGSNAKGQLATGDTEDAHTFQTCSFQDCAPGQLPPNTVHIEDIVCGANHTLLLLRRARNPTKNAVTELWGCGDGNKGQLGLGVSSSVQAFHTLDLGLERLGLRDFSVRLIGASWETSYVVVSCPGRDDVLLSMGADDFGDLGVGGAHAKGKSVDSPVYIVDLAGLEPLKRRQNPSRLSIKAIVTGLHHIVVHFSSETEDHADEYLAGWGTSRHGQLGEWVDDAKKRPIPFLSSPVLIPIGSNAPVQAIAAGAHHTVVLHSTKRLSALGSNRKDQLSGVQNLHDVVAVGCTWHGTYAVTNHGQSWSILSTGNHARGQLGRSPQTNQARAPAPVELPFSADTRRFIKMACGSEHVLCSVASTPELQTEVWAWGWNEHGNLALGHIQDQELPVKIWPPIDDSAHSEAIDVWAGNGTTWIALSS